MERDRSLVTVLFTDIVGSTERAAELRDAGWRDLRQEHDRRVRRELRRFGGREINTAGDSFLATFERPARAIACAGAIRTAVRELALEVRAGLHMGEIEGAGRDLGGLALNIGARVAAEAGPGEILVSRTVHDALAGSAFDFEDRGVRALKGVPGEWRLFAVTGVAEDAAHALPGRWPTNFLRRRKLVSGALVGAVLLVAAALYMSRRDAAVALNPEEVLAADAAPGIAVLPFRVNEPELERWHEGMVDLLSTNLDGVAGLRTIDSRTVLSRWGRAVPEDRSPELATALGVARDSGARYGLIGSVVSSGSDLRLIAEVYDLRENARSLGKEEVQGEQDSIFGLIDRLSIALLRRILEEQGSAPPALDLSRITTTSLPALKAYLEGQALLRRSRFSDATAAFERAIAADSTFALAWFHLSDASGWQETFQVATDQIFEAHRRAWAQRERLPDRERRILETSQLEDLEELQRRWREITQTYPDDARAWFGLGDALFHKFSLVTRSEREAPFLRALRLDPLYTPAYIHLLDLAFAFGDSAAVARLLGGFERGAAGSVFARKFRLAYGLAFSDPAFRAALVASLDTVPTPVLHGAIELFGHPCCPAVYGQPRLLGVQELALAELIRRPEFSPAQAIALQFWNALGQGKLRRAIEMIEDSRMDPDPRTRELRRLYSLVQLGLVDSLPPIDPEILAAAFTLPPRGERITVRRFAWIAGRAIDEGRWDVYGRAVDAMRNTIRAYAQEGDSANASFHAAVLDATSGYEAAARGRIDHGIWLLEDVYRREPHPEWARLLFILLARQGRSEKALRYAELVGPDPMTWALAAPLYEQTGDRDQAIRAWAWVVQAWEDADPELQPRVAEARQAIARLRGL
jgi:class 3 adenylate cyclase/tetratricopeptide (TPR) repeat protein